MPLGVVDQEVGDFGGDAAVGPAVEHCGWGERTVAEAVDGLEGEVVIRGGLAQFHAEAIFDVLDQFVAAHGLAGFGAADVEDVAARRMMAKIVIEGDDAVHFGVRYVERVGDDGHRGLIDVSELFLQGVEDWEERAGEVLEFPDAGEREVGVPGWSGGLIDAHAQRSCGSIGAKLCWARFSVDTKAS